MNTPARRKQLKKHGLPSDMVFGWWARREDSLRYDMVNNKASVGRVHRQKRFGLRPFCCHNGMHAASLHVPDRTYWHEGSYIYLTGVFGRVHRHGSKHSGDYRVYLWKTRVTDEFALASDTQQLLWLRRQGAPINISDIHNPTVDLSAVEYTIEGYE